MASASVKRAEPVTPPITGVTLNLSLEEARALSALLYSGVAGVGHVRELLTSGVGPALYSAVGRYKFTGIQKAPFWADLTNAVVVEARSDGF